MPAKSLQQNTNYSEDGSGSHKRQGPPITVQTESPQNEDKIVDKPRDFDFPEAPTVPKKKHQGRLNSSLLAHMKKTTTPLGT